MLLTVAFGAIAALFHSCRVPTTSSATTGVMKQMGASIGALGGEQQANDDIHNKYPRVYILPIPRELHWDLLNCRNASKEEIKNIEWLVKDDDFTRFQQISPERPFGEQITSELFNYTPHHPHIKGGEYDFQAYYHRMLEGYIYRVDSPELADLMYVPHFQRRQSCHPQGAKAASNLIHDHVEWFMRKFPAHRFFSAAGNVCSCQHSKHHMCYPFKTWLAPDLAERHRVMAWERRSNHSEMEGNLVVPYVTQNHDMPWQTSQDRPILVLAVFGFPRHVCVGCGPCHHEEKDDDPKKCRPLCKNIRNELRDHMKPHAAKNEDVVLWDSAHNPSTKWFPNGTKFWPPTMVMGRMMESTFCLQPSGDTVSRKSFFESIQAGCIPVVFRNDDAYLEQLPFSNVIPYREMYYFISESCALHHECFIVSNNTMLPSDNFIDVLRSVTNDEIQRRRQLIKQYGRMLLFSDNDGTEGGYNDVRDPDAFLMSLREMWRLAQIS